LVKSFTFGEGSYLIFTYIQT